MIQLTDMDDGVLLLHKDITIVRIYESSFDKNINMEAHTGINWVYCKNGKTISSSSCVKESVDEVKELFGIKVENAEEDGFKPDMVVFASAITNDELESFAKDHKIVCTITREPPPWKHPFISMLERVRKE